MIARARARAEPWGRPLLRLLDAERHLRSGALQDAIGEITIAEGELHTLGNHLHRELCSVYRCHLTSFDVDSSNDALHQLGVVEPMRYAAIHLPAFAVSRSE